ncbi:MAG: hypothetical protein KDE19_05300 [Caldilineaceae bacterium]|nr:hypothetical protein [Caldilineaceae bacterium]
MLRNRQLSFLNTAITGLTIFLVQLILFSINSYTLWADEIHPPQPISGTLTEGAVGPLSSAPNATRLYNDYLVPALPASARESDIVDNGEKQEEPGRGVDQSESGIGSGVTLYANAPICNDFNQSALWGTAINPNQNLWRDYYGGWGSYAADDASFYFADRVTFSRERVVGPGARYGSEESALKIASRHPYAAGIGSPPIQVSPGTTVTVAVHYMIFDHDTSGRDFDWASLGLKADATADQATFANGYIRGHWAILTHQVVAGESGQVMVLLQAHSPAILNSNIYFDDVQIAVDGVFLEDCTGK